MVDPEYHGDVLALGWRGNEHLWRAGFKVQVSVFAVGEDATAFKHQIDLFCGPRQFGRRFNGRHANISAIDAQAFALGLDVKREHSMHTVVLEKVSKRMRIGQVVDMDNL